MNLVPSILMVTWNRCEYFERTISNLLADEADFRIFLWDNGSADGVRDIINDLKDDRIQAKHFSTENVGQFSAWHWFIEQCPTDIAGKLDDDIIGEPGWMTRFSEVIADCPEIGALGAWVYLESEWDEAIAGRKVVRVGRHAVFRNGWVAGCIFLARVEYLKRYSFNDPLRFGVPLDQMGMTKAGLINGYPMPISFAENLDDPRSPHCRMNRPGGWDQFAAYSARMRNFSSPEEYGRWIAADAQSVLKTSVEEQIRMFSPTAFDRLKANLNHRAKRFLRR
jgi:glycosyltransferase involved in cell wall biosynthesis